MDTYEVRFWDDEYDESYCVATFHSIKEAEAYADRQNGLAEEPNYYVVLA